MKLLKRSIFKVIVFRQTVLKYTTFALICIFAAAMSNASNDQTYGESANGQPQQQANAYMFGFIKGALLADEVFVGSLDKSLSGKSSTFSERAFKTRVGRKPVPDSAYATEFCLPDGLSRQTVAASVSEKVLSEHYANAGIEEVQKGLSEHAYKALAQLYPCS